MKEYQEANKQGQYPTGDITNNYAWIVAKRVGKTPPYRGYALDLKNGQSLVFPPIGPYQIVNNVTD